MKEFPAFFEFQNRHYVDPIIMFCINKCLAFGFDDDKFVDHYDEELEWFNYTLEEIEEYKFSMKRL